MSKINVQYFSSLPIHRKKTARVFVRCIQECLEPKLVQQCNILCYIFQKNRVTSDQDKKAWKPLLKKVGSLQDLEGKDLKQKFLEIDLYCQEILEVINKEFIDHIS